MLHVLFYLEHFVRQSKIHQLLQNPAGVIQGKFAVVL